uniref:MARVEL domain-containing protein n=1 Tax=Strigamia maritima TaxID=126957 RepID=T1JHY9_STRMM
MPCATKIAGGIFIFYFIILGIFSLLLIAGTRRDYRGFLLPYLVWLAVLICYTVSLGIWFSARYYTYPISTWSSIMSWFFSCLIIYCWLCVFSQYQVLKEYQTGNVVVLYP